MTISDSIARFRSTSTIKPAFFSSNQTFPFQVIAGDRSMFSFLSGSQKVWAG